MQIHSTFLCITSCQVEAVLYIPQASKEPQQEGRFHCFRLLRWALCADGISIKLVNYYLVIALGLRLLWIHLSFYSVH